MRILNKKILLISGITLIMMCLILSASAANITDKSTDKLADDADDKKVTSAPKFNVDTSYERSEVMEKSIDDEARDLNLDPLVIKFLDADLASEKNDILCKLHPIITNDMIDIMALSLGVVVKEGDVYDRYNDLRTCLTTMEKFESTRLR